jgi:tripartite-type tricarboxylate transporter receptor subunit TctC
MTRLGSILALVAAAGCALAAHPGAAQEPYPSRTVKIVVPAAPGSTTDTLARLVADQLGQKWGKAAIVENIAGGAMNVGATNVARAAPDGYTMLVAPPAPLSFSHLLYKDLAYEPTKWVPITMLAKIPNVLVVRKELPAATLRELIDYAKANPGKLNYASLGTGTSGHLATTLFSDLAGVKLQHVPYSQYSQAVTDFLSGRTALWITTLGGAIGNIQAGKMRALAVSGESRAKQLPDVPTFKEMGVGFSDESSWYALFAPKGTPQAIIGKVNADMTRIIALPDVKERELTMGYRFIGGPPNKLAAFVRSEIAKWAELAQSASLTPR